jgi:hypothetical protein
MPNQTEVDEMHRIEANEMQTNEAVKYHAPSRTSSDLHGDDASVALKSIDSERVIFNAAQRLLKPGAFYRYVIHLYAERKLLVFFSIHFIATMIIWCKL